MGKKQWKEREFASISELEDLWLDNRNLEIARSIILAVKDFQKISLEERLHFLDSLVFDVRSDLLNEIGGEKTEKYIGGPLLETFLFLLPEWKQEFEKYGRTILQLCRCSYTDNSYYAIPTGKIKKFIHSYLNSVKKENIPEETTIHLMIKNGMFEELVNYNFISDTTLKVLWDFLFTKSGNYADEYEEVVDAGWWLNDRKPNFSGIRELLYDRKPNLSRMRELLCFWDKVENRHALATLWTILAKRGDLEKIFSTE